MGDEEAPGSLPGTSELPRDFRTDEDDPGESEASIAKALRELGKAVVDIEPFPRLATRYSSRPDDEYVFIPQDTEQPPVKIDPQVYERQATTVDADAATNFAKADWHSHAKRKYFNGPTSG